MDAIQYTNNPITLAPPQETEQEPVTLAPPLSPSQSPIESVVNRRANITTQGSGDILGLSQEEIRLRFIQGQEDNLRKQTALTMDYQSRMNNVQAFKDYANRTPGQLDPNTSQYILNRNSNPTDPDLVLEKNYTDSTLSALNTASTSLGNGVWTDALQNIPFQVEDTKQKASDFGTKRQFLQTMYETAHQAKEQQSWPSYILDETLQLSQLYPEFIERGNNPEVGYLTGGIGLSANIKSQADSWFKMDNETFVKSVGPKLDAMIKRNPSLAEDFISRAMGETDKEAFVGNAFTLLALPDMYLAGKFLSNMTKKMLHYNQTQQAVKDVLAEARKPNATVADVQAAAGDLGGSAVRDVSEQVVKGLEGQTVDQSTLTMKSMTSNFPKDLAQIPEGTPRNREIATRIRDELAAPTSDIGPAILAMNKVNRTPLSLASQENVNIVKGAIKSDYRGPWNSLLDVFIDKDSWNRFTNTWDYQLHIGNMNGEYFSNPQTAANFARDNGIGDAVIRPGKGFVESADYVQSLRDIDVAKAQRNLVQGEIDKLKKAAKDKALTPEGKKNIKDQVVELQKQYLEHTRNINFKEANLNTTSSTKRLAEIRQGIANLQADKDLKKLFPDEYKQKIKDLQQEARALNYGTALPIQRVPVIKQQGAGFYIQVTRPLDETTPVMRDLMIKDAQGNLRREAISDATSGVSSWKNALVGKWRSPDDTLSAIETQERKSAVYSQAVLNHLGHNLSKYIEDVTRGYTRFDELGNRIPWYFALPRYVAGIPYRKGKDLVGTALNKELGQAAVLSRKQMFKEWERAIDYARRNKGPDGATGYFFQNQGQLEDYYLRTFERMPSYAESLAYFAKVELDEYNRVLTNIAVYRNKSRVGTMSHQVIMTDGTNRIASNAFDGVQRKEFPGGEGNIWVMDNSSGKPSKVYTLEGNHIPNEQRVAWKEMVANGKLKVIEIWDPEARPLNGFGGVEQQRIRYVLTDAADSKQIDFNQVNRRGGGHFDYDYEHYLKQAIIRNENIGNRSIAHYEGDMTVMALANRAMGRDLAEHMDAVRQLIKENKIDDARAYTRAKLAMEFDGDDGLHSWFKPGRDKDGKVTAPRLNLDEKFHVVPKNKSIVGLDSSLEQRINAAGYEFRNGTNSGSLARQFQVAYTKERDAYGLIAPNNIGTVKKPLYKYEPAKLVDAMPTMQRALNRAIKSTFMDDYKMMAVEHWLREAEPHLKTKGSDTISDVRSSPFYHFHNPVYRDGTPREVEKNLEFNRYKIQQFIGIPSEFDTTIHALTQHLFDAAYTAGAALTGDTAGTLKFKIPRSLADTAIIPIWMLNRIHDPVTKLRSLTYNFKLGLFNLPQILVQAQTHASIWAIAGRNGGAGTYAGMLHTWSRFGDDTFLRHLDNYATKMNFLGVKWKPGEFFEARKELGKTGFEHVAGEYAVLDDAHGYKFVRNDFNAFLDLGQQFFKEGERWTRYSAWYTAFKEYRTANPTGAITKEARTSILQRADLLTTNMSRASSSALHTGVLGLSTQFLSYQLRLAELFMGKRLGETVQQRSLARLRLFGVYSGLYGVPAAFGLTGLPVSDYFRGAAIDAGYFPGKNFITSLFMEGIPSIVTALVTGEGDYKKGNFYNFGDRYGAQGFTQVREALRSDGAWWKILGGAGVTTLVNTVTNADGFTKAMMSFAKGDSPETRFKLKLDDVVDAGKEIASVSAAWRLIVALNTGRWYSKNESFIGPVSEKNAAFMALTSLSPQEQDDLYTKGNIIKSQTAVYKYAENKFIQEIQRGIAAKMSNNPEQSHDYFRRAFSYLEAANMPMEKRFDAIAKSAKGWESRIDQSDFSFYLKDVPTDKFQSRLDTYKEKQRYLNNRK